MNFMSPHHLDKRIHSLVHEISRRHVSAMQTPTEYAQKLSLQPLAGGTITSAAKTVHTNFTSVMKKEKRLKYIYQWNKSLSARGANVILCYYPNQEHYEPFDGQQTEHAQTAKRATNILTSGMWCVDWKHVSNFQWPQMTWHAKSVEGSSTK